MTEGGKMILDFRFRWSLRYVVPKMGLDSENSKERLTGSTRILDIGYQGAGSWVGATSAPKSV